jgi:hypothetical protein
MDGHEQFSQPHTSENIARLLVNELEPGNYSLKERGVDITIQITDVSDLGQHIIVRTDSVDENVSTTIKVKHDVGIELPEISAMSTRTRKNRNDQSITYWHTHMPKTSWDGRYRSDDTMQESYLVEIIEYVLSPNKQLIPKD